MLIVAESNYRFQDWEKHGEEINTFIIQERAEERHTQAFHTRIFNLLKTHIGADNKKDFWHKVAFTNYLQVVLENPKEREISHFYTHDNIFKEHFLYQVEKWKPNHILLFSLRLGNLFEYNEIKNILLNQGRRFKCVRHPSRLTKIQTVEMEKEIMELFSNPPHHNSLPANL